MAADHVRRGFFATTASLHHVDVEMKSENFSTTMPKIQPRHSSQERFCDL